MSRVLPMMIFCVSMVGVAVFHAHSKKETYAYLVPEATPVAVETLTQ